MTESMNPAVEIWTGGRRAATSSGFQGTGLPEGGFVVVRDRGGASLPLAGDHRYGPSASARGGALLARRLQNPIAKPVSGLLPVSRQVLTS